MTLRIPVSLLGIFCLAIPASGDEARFLPEGEHLLLSFKVSAFLKSKTFAELKKRSAQAAQKIASGLEEGLGVASDNIERISLGQGVPPNGLGRSMIVVTTKKPVTFKEILAKLEPGARALPWEDVKVAAFTVHQPGHKPEPTQSWQPFCVPEAKVVLNGPLASLKKILERNKGPNLAAGMRTGLKEVGPDNALSLVFDLQRLRVERTEDKVPGDLFEPLEILGFDLAALKGLDVLAFKVNETDKVTATATFFCKDAAAAASVQQMIAGSCKMIKDMAPNPDNLPQDQQEKARAILTVLEAVKVARTDNRVSATLTVEPALVAVILHAVLALPGF